MLAGRTFTRHACDVERREAGPLSLSTVIRSPDVPLAYTAITRPPVVEILPRRLPNRRRKTGLGRWPKPEVQFANLFPKRTDHMSNS